MYLHLGQETVVNEKEVIGIFDLDTTTVSLKTREFLRINDKKGNMEYISSEIPKTFVVTASKENKKVF